MLAKEYSPFGSMIYSVGDFDTDYGYTGELTDGTGLINLRARYYDPGTGRFITKDTWSGDYQMPATLVKWLYANSNPVRYVDPSGNYYNRAIARTFALAHDNDLISYTLDTHDMRDMGTNCANFASNVLYEGGIRDTRNNNERIRVEGRIPMWDKTLVQDSQSPYEGFLSRNKKNGDYYLGEWYRVKSLKDFLIQNKSVANTFEYFGVIPHFNYEDIKGNVNNDDWLNFLAVHENQIQAGDLVIYDNSLYGEYAHAAVIVGWGYQTAYGSDGQDPIGSRIPQIVDAWMSMGITVHNDCLKDFFWAIEKPRVVEMGGSLLYGESRSIDNTSDAAVVTGIHILHLKDN